MVQERKKGYPIFIVYDIFLTELNLNMEYYQTAFWIGMTYCHKFASNRVLAQNKQEYFGGH